MCSDDILNSHSSTEEVQDGLSVIVILVCLKFVIKDGRQWSVILYQFELFGMGCDP